LRRVLSATKLSPPSQKGLIWRIRPQSKTWQHFCKSARCV